MGGLFVLVLVLVLETAGRVDRYRRVSTGTMETMKMNESNTPVPQCGADIPVCTGLRGQAGMPAPHYHAPSLRLAGTASPHLCWRAFAEASQRRDDNRRRPIIRRKDALFHDYVPPLQG